MTAQAFEIRPKTSAEMTRYRIEVIASTVDDVVASAGGWLFDRAMSGWDVNLLVATPADVRPLQILGINPTSAGATLGPVAKWPPTQAIAVGADVFASNARVRRTVVTALERGLSEVTIWGAPCTPELRRRATEVEHQLSSAARVFKAHALAATTRRAGPCAPTDPTERFCSGSRWFPSYESDLQPVS